MSLPRRTDRDSSDSGKAVGSQRRRQLKRLSMMLHTLVSVLIVSMIVWIGAGRPSLLGWAVLLLFVGMMHAWATQRVAACASMHPADIGWSMPEHLHDTLNTFPDGLLVTDEYDRIILANESFVEASGFSYEELLGQRAGSLPWVCSSHSSVHDLPWLRTARFDLPQAEQLMRFQPPGGVERYFAINSSPVKTDQPDCQGALIVLRDVTKIEAHRAELEQMLIRLRSSRDAISHKNQELELLASEDSLTGCFNRRAFFEMFRTEWSRNTREALPLSCLMVDIDHFKQVNDLFGHQVGDEVLKSVACTLRKSFESPANVGRYGGEEFCVMLPGADLGTAAAIAESVRREIEAIRVAEQPDLRLSASFGVSSRVPGVAQLEDLIRQADECLYFAKQHGRNRVVDRQQYLHGAEDEAEQELCLAHSDQSDSSGGQVGAYIGSVGRPSR